MKLLRALPVFALVAAIVLGFTGCSTSYQKAGVHAALRQITVDDDNTATLRVELQNENIVALAVTSTEFKVRLNGEAFGQAVGTKPFGLTELGKAEHEAKLKLADAAHAARLRELLAGGSVEYTIDCRLLCESGDEDIILTTVAQGRLASR